MVNVYSPTPIDGYSTPTSTLQASTENVIKSHILPAGGAQPELQKRSHFEFLLRNLRQGFPERYVSQDASQPWLIYWTLHGFSILGAGLDDVTKKRSIETLLALQHPDGGFAGGPGQAAHLLPTYAAVCSFAVVGRPSEGGGWESIDRKKMYDFFMSLKQPDGSFLVSHHGEVDVRGIYCLLAVATLLNLLTPELLAGVPDFLATCQTYEGGFGNASFPGWAFEAGPAKTYDPSAPRPPLGEAHGGYTFCATASWVLLQSFIDLYYAPASQTSTVSLPQKPQIDTRALPRWCTQMQGLPIELGGFKGRTNKLVDGCYSWWVGGCVVLVEALLGVGAHSEPPTEANNNEDEAHKAWDDIDDSLFDRKALQEYILLAGQHPAGGLRDKPPKAADAYHTLYCSAGLSAAQHRVIPSEPRKNAIISAWDAAKALSRDGTGFRATSEAEREKLDALRKQTCAHVLSWAEEEGTELYVGGAANRVNATHPLFNLTTTHSDAMMAYFYGQTFPSRHFAPAKK
ncbi:terpenoid cyclases/Protein prenyltransferase [Trametes versicolor FP-101664 SS1]|uniref:terpenoid cyclases/Protein prenyltransferase n=1 Tax=Trametes versicolor (strain FP-101664) TaxID=717944 RepID=UPI0004623242|nr:terpenoid cyclases/Protein prenyltransferase [Trametes versicolor FP-101664 SS1]EIW52190.1 terpenoid cyclases/Protein prenyltransferase [Trametes versicolor FP-101664 SS1]